MATYQHGSARFGAQTAPRQRIGRSAITLASFAAGFLPLSATAAGWYLSVEDMAKVMNGELEKNGGWGANCNGNNVCDNITTSVAMFGPVTGPACSACSSSTPTSPAAAPKACWKRPTTSRSTPSHELNSYNERLATRSLMIEIRHLRSLVAIADSGKLATAADRVHLTQSALSHQIRAIETHYGMPLFERTRQGQQLVGSRGTGLRVTWRFATWRHFGQLHNGGMGLGIRVQGNRVE